MANWIIKIPPNIETWVADNWRAVDAALKSQAKLDSKVNSTSSGLSTISGKVRVDGNDSTAEYLDQKITAGNDIDFIESNDGRGAKTITMNLNVYTSTTAPSAPTEGMLWYDTDEPEPEIFLIGDGAAGVDFQIKVDGETNDGVITWMEDEDQFKFVDRLQTDGGIIGKITTATDTYIVLVSDETVVCNKATAFTVTLPVAAVGQKFTIKNIGAGAVTVDADSTDLIDGSLTQSLIQWESMQIVCYVANNWGVL